MANVSISQLISDIIGLKAPMAEAVSEFERLQAKMAMSGKRTDELSKKIVELQNGLSSMGAKDIEEVNKQIVDLQNKVGELAKSTSESVSRSVELLPEYIRECVKVIEAEGAKGAEAMGKAFKVASENIGEAFDRLGASRELIDEVFGKISDKGAVLSTLWLNASGVKNDSTGVEMVSTYERLLSVRERIADSAQKQNEADRTSFEMSKEELAINEQRDRLAAALMSVKGVSDDKTETLREQRQILVEFEDELKRANAEWNSFQSQSFQRATDPSIIQQRKEEIDALTKSVEKQRAAVKQLEEEYNNQVSVESIMDKINNGGAEEKSEGLKELKAIYRSLSDEMRENEEIGGVILRNIQMLNGETRQMNSELGKSVTATGEVNTQGMRMRTMLMTLKQEIMQNTQTLNGYDAEIASLTDKMREMERDGKVNTEEYTQAAKSVEELNEKRNSLMETTAELIVRTGEYQRVMSSTNALVQNMADPTLGMKAMAGTLNEVVQVGTAATSVMTLFGIKNDDVAKGIMKLQALQSIANTTQRITNDLLSKNGTLQKWHALAVKARILYRKQLNIEEKKAIANEAGLTGATVANTAATNVASAANIGLAGTLRAVGAAMKAVPVIGWIMAAVAAVGTLTGLIVSLNSEERKMTIADKDRIKMREKERETNMAVRKDMENESTRLSYNIMRMKETKEGTEEWRKVVSDVAKQLGVSEEYIIKNKEKVEDLAAAWHSMKEQQLLADKYVEAAADARIQAEEEIMKMGSSSRKERKEGSKELEGLTNSEQRQYKRLANTREEQEKRIAQLKERLIKEEQAAVNAASENERKAHQLNANNIKNTLAMVENSMGKTQSQIDVLNSKIRDNAQEMSDEYIKQAQEAEEAAKKAKERVDAEAYAAKEIQRQNLAYETRANAEAEVVKSLTLGNMRMDANVEKLGRLNKGSGEYNKTIKAIAGDLGVNDEWLKSNIDKVGDLAEAWKKVKIAEAMSGKYLESAAEESVKMESLRIMAISNISGEALNEMINDNAFLTAKAREDIKAINAEYVKASSERNLTDAERESYMKRMDNILAESKKRQDGYTTSMKNLANEEMEKVAEESKALAEAQKHNKQTMASAVNARKEIDNIQVELERLRTEGQPDNYLKKSAALDKWYNEQKVKFRKHNDVLVELDKLYNAKKAKIDDEERKRYEKVLNDNYKLVKRMQLEFEKDKVKIAFEIDTKNINNDLSLTAQQRNDMLVKLYQQYAEDMKRIEREIGNAALAELEREFEDKVKYLNLTSDAEKENNEEYLSIKAVYDEKKIQQEQKTENTIAKIVSDTNEKIKSSNISVANSQIERGKRIQQYYEILRNNGKKSSDSLVQADKELQIAEGDLRKYSKATYDEYVNMAESERAMYGERMMSAVEFYDKAIDIQWQAYQVMSDNEKGLYADHEMTFEEFQEKSLEAFSNYTTKSQELTQALGDGWRNALNSISESFASLGTVFAGFIEDEVARVKIEQMIALAQVAINQGVAIAAAIKGIMEAKEAGNSAAIIAQKVIAIGAAVAAITAQMVTSIQTIRQATNNISAYAEGTEHHRGGDAIVGEGGSPELVIARNRKYLIEKPTLIRDLPVGSKVLPLDGRRGDMVDLSNIERGIDSLNGKSMVRIDVGRNIYSYIVKGASKTRVINKQFAH